MSTYSPIGKPEAPQLQDVVLSVTKEPFLSAPPLSFLDSYKEVVKASSVYFDPTQPNLSQAAPVTYSISRTYTRLSEKVVELRHNGQTVDLEIYIDNYSYVQAEPVVGEFNPNPSLPRIAQGDRYERQTLCYVYAYLPVPPASGKVWDGRYSLCVDPQGFEVSSESRLPALRSRVLEILSSPSNVPYTVLSVGGLANTIQTPAGDPYEAVYRLKVESFISSNYNSRTLPRPPISQQEVVQEITVEIPAEDPLEGTGRYQFDGAYVVAVLDGDYFLNWAKLYKYTEILKTTTVPSKPEDYAVKIFGYEPDGDLVIGQENFIDLVDENNPYYYVSCALPPTQPTVSQLTKVGSLSSLRLAMVGVEQQLNLVIDTLAAPGTVTFSVVSGPSTTFSETTLDIENPGTYSTFFTASSTGYLTVIASVLVGEDIFYSNPQQIKVINLILSASSLNGRTNTPLPFEVTLENISSPSEVNFSVVEALPATLNPASVTLTPDSNTAQSTVTVTDKTNFHLQATAVIEGQTFSSNLLLMQFDRKIDPETYVVTLMDSSGSMNSAFGSIEAAIVELRSILRDLYYETQVNADKYVPPPVYWGDERYVKAIAEEYRDDPFEPKKYLFLVFLNEANDSYHGIPRNLGSEPTATYWQDYNQFVDSFNSFDLFNVLIFVPSSFPPSGGEIACNEQVLDAVDGLNGYLPLREYNADYRLYWPINATGSQLYDEIATFLDL